MINCKILGREENFYHPSPLVSKQSVQPNLTIIYTVQEVFPNFRDKL